jgi:rod shape-determining protein MreB and related proteins
LLRFFRPLGFTSGGDVAVDLGTANTVVYVRGRGVVLFEPSVVAVDDRSGEVHAVGEEAKRMIGRTPATIRALRPLRHGVIADFYLTERMLHHFIRRAIGSRRRARASVCVPSGITDIERRAVEEATVAAGARSAYLIEEPMAGAERIGANQGEEGFGAKKTRPEARDQVAQNRGRMPSVPGPIVRRCGRDRPARLVLDCVRRRQPDRVLE